MTFKIGDLVKFPGLVTAKVRIPKIQGELVAGPKNVPKGVMAIKDDVKRMFFLADGTIYCHPHHGCMLELVAPATPEKIELQAAVEKLQIEGEKDEKTKV